MFQLSRTYEIHLIKFTPKKYLRKKQLLLVVLIAIIFSGEAYGASRYVDNSGSPACSNSPTSGSEASPWCTINYALSRLTGGDDLYVKAGTYSEEFQISGPNGNATKSTTIKSYPGHIVTIRGGGNTGRVK